VTKVVGDNTNHRQQVTTGKPQAIGTSGTLSPEAALGSSAHQQIKNQHINICPEPPNGLYSHRNGFFN
jgi:hypothetical protein